MGDRTKKVLKFLGLGVLWVYILSIRVEGDTIFYYANDILVKNQIVEAIDRQLADSYDGALKVAGNAYTRVTGRSKGL
jgi:hypothetical protein